MKRQITKLVCMKQSKRHEVSTYISVWMDKYFGACNLLFGFCLIKLLRCMGIGLKIITFQIRENAYERHSPPMFRRD